MTLNGSLLVSGKLATNRGTIGLAACARLHGPRRGPGPPLSLEGAMAACARARGAAHHAPANGINRQRPKIITRRCGAGRPITSGGPRRELRPLRRPLRRALAIQVVARIPPGARHAVAAHASCRRGRAYHQRRRAGMHSRPLVGWPCYEPTARAQASAREGGETPTSARPAAARQHAARTASGASGATGHTCCNLL